jgi:hypothetical protein
VTTLLATVPGVRAPTELKKTAELRRRGGLVRALRPPTRPVAWSTPAHSRWRRSLVAAAAAVLVVAAAVAIFWPRQGGEITRLAAPGGQLAVDTTPVDFGSSAVQAAVRITNTGREPLVFQTRAAVPWLSFAGGDGTLDPGTGVVVTALLDRSRAPEGAADTQIRVRSNGGSAMIPVRAVVERPPELSGVEVTPQSVVVRRCPGSTPAQVRAAIVEESGLASVDLHWLRPGTVEQVSPMSAEAQASYRGALGPFDTPGDVRWWVSAVDIRNNRADSPPQVLRVVSC